MIPTLRGATGRHRPADLLPKHGLLTVFSRARELLRPSTLLTNLKSISFKRGWGRSRSIILCSFERPRVFLLKLTEVLSSPVPAQKQNISFLVEGGALGSPVHYEGLEPCDDFRHGRQPTHFQVSSSLPKKENTMRVLGACGGVRVV